MKCTSADAAINDAAAGGNYWLAEATIFYKLGNSVFARGKQQIFIS